MGKFFDAVKSGIKAATDSGPQRYTLVDRLVHCPHCGHDEFAEGRAQLNTVGMSFLNLDCADRSATTLACAECGRIQWFLQAPERTD